MGTVRHERQRTASRRSPWRNKRCLAAAAAAPYGACAVGVARARVALLIPALARWGGSAKRRKLASVARQPAEGAAAWVVRDGAAAETGGGGKTRSGGGLALASAVAAGGGAHGPDAVGAPPSARAFLELARERLEEECDAAGAAELLRSAAAESGGLAFVRGSAGRIVGVRYGGAPPARRGGRRAPRRSLDDPEFFACAVRVLAARVLERCGARAPAREAYEAAVAAFPWSVEAKVAFAKLLLPDAVAQTDLELYESLLEAASAPSRDRRFRTGKAEDDDPREAERGLGFSRQAAELLAMFYCQRGDRDAEASEILSSLKFQYRLSPEVLHYAAASSPKPPTEGKAVLAECDKYVKVVDDALHPNHLERLRRVFAPSSPFWSEHGYDEFESSGYFSYLYDLAPPGSESGARNVLERVVDRVYGLVRRHFPDKARDARVAEWWAHCRPHAAGHQLHFDSEDEGRGVVRHPLVSVVVYLSDEGEFAVAGDDRDAAAPAAESKPGFAPTLVTDQTLGGELATKGWLVHPKVNRVTMFDAKFLHGVIPGRGLSPRKDARRISFMIGFWDKITPRENDKPGASQRFPYGDTDYTWPAMLADSDFRGEDDRVEKHYRTRRDLVPPAAVSEVWTTVNATAWSSLARSRKGALPPYDVCFQGF